MQPCLSVLEHIVSFVRGSLTGTDTYTHADTHTHTCNSSQAKGSWTHMIMLWFESENSEFVPLRVWCGLWLHICVTTCQAKLLNTNTATRRKPCPSACCPKQSAKQHNVEYTPLSSISPWCINRQTQAVHHKTMRMHGWCYTSLSLHDSYDTSRYTFYLLLERGIAFQRHSIFGGSVKFHCQNIQTYWVPQPMIGRLAETPYNDW